jgi:hypothetical protein
MGKTRFEQMCWNLAGVTIKNFHSDNGVYDASMFRDDCISKDQSQTFSGVGAKHQNAVAERNIQTICYWARHMMVHAAVHWPSNGSDNIRLWPFAVQHAVWLFNRIPNRITGLTPLEVFTKTKSDHRDLQRAHVWGCPVFVLDPCLQDGKKIPKWNRRARLAQFVGFSPEHSTLVANVRHPWLAMSATCRRHVGDKAKCRQFSCRQGKFGDMDSCVSAHFCVAISRH